MMQFDDRLPARRIVAILQHTLTWIFLARRRHVAETRSEQFAPRTAAATEIRCLKVLLVLKYHSEVCAFQRRF